MIKFPDVYAACISAANTRVVDAQPGAALQLIVAYARDLYTLATGDVPSEFGDGTRESGTTQALRSVAVISAAFR